MKTTATYRQLVLPGLPRPWHLACIDPDCKMNPSGEVLDGTPACPFCGDVVRVVYWCRGCGSYSTAQWPGGLCLRCLTARSKPCRECRRYSVMEGWPEDLCFRCWRAQVTCRRSAERS